MRLRAWRSPAPRIAVMSSPPIKTRPEVGSTSRFRQRRRVDLPDPLGPMIETKSPFATSSVTESRALVPPGKTFVRPSTLTSGSLRMWA